MSPVRSPFYYFTFSCVYLFILFTYFCLQKDQKIPNWSPWLDVLPRVLARVLAQVLARILALMFGLSPKNLPINKQIHQSNNKSV